MKPERVERLKSLIEVVDRTVFPKKPATVYIGQPRHIERRRVAASFSMDVKTIRGYLKFSLLATPLLTGAFIGNFVAYAISSIFLPRKKRFFFHKMLYMEDLLWMWRRKLFNQISYQVINTPTYFKGSDDLALLTIAIHEVRHRVQFERAYAPLAEDVDTEIRRIFDQGYDFLAKDIQTNRKLEKRPDIEIDANFVAFNLRNIAKGEFSNTQSISNEHLTAFMEKYMYLMTWENKTLPNPLY